MDGLTEEIQFIVDLAEKGEIHPVIDRSYPLDEIVAAHRYIDQGHKKGNIVIIIAHKEESK